MTTQISKAALKQLDKVAHLVSSIRTQKPIVNQRLASQAPRIPIGEVGDVLSEPDWNFLQDWGIRKLEDSSNEIRLIDRTRRNEQVQLAQQRRNRGEFVRSVSSEYRRVRRSFSGTYGDDALTQVALEAPLAEGFRAINEQLRELSVRMLDPDTATALPEPLAGQSPIDLTALGTAWQARSQQLDQLMEAIDTLINSLQESRVLLEETLQHSRLLYSNVGRLGEGLYRLAGLDELADRMRATIRTPRKKVPNEPAPNEPVPNEPDAPPVEESAEEETATPTPQPVAKDSKPDAELVKALGQPGASAA